MLVLLIAVALAGCNRPAAGPTATAAPAASAPTPAADGGQTTVLFDAAKDATAGAHRAVVPDPFGGQGDVLAGVLGHHQEQQLVLVNGQGFFTVPADRKGCSVVFRLAVTGPRGVRIVFSTSGQSVSYSTTVPDEGKWCDVSVPLSTVADRLGAGNKVFDITLFQKDLSGKARLYLQRIALTAKPAP